MNGRVRRGGFLRAGEIPLRGQKEGCFRSGIDTFDLHMLCTAFAFFRVSNRYTLSTLFDKDLSEPERRARTGWIPAQAAIGVAFR